MIARTWFAASVLWALAAAACTRVPPLPPLAPSDVVLAFGDSLTYGTGAAADAAYPLVLGRLIQRTVVSSGVPGEASAAGLRRLPAVLDRVAPRLVVLCLGGNDILRRVPAAETESNLRAMVRLARARGVAVVLIGVPRPPLFNGEVADMTAIAEDLDVPIERDVLRTLLLDAGMKADSIHPNAAGYARLADAVAALLRAAGAV